MISPDKYQRKIIDSNEKDILVLAGAGSGKTYTLLNRMYRLVRYVTVDPECILVLTFTRVACDSMRSKYIKMMDSIYDSTPDFCTFHSFCYKLICDYPAVMKKCGYSSIPSIADDTDMIRYYDKARDMSSCKLTYKKLSHPERLKGKDLRSYELYQKALKKVLDSENVIDYDTLSETVCHLLATKDSSVDPVFSRYKYLFVDEFQDTDQYQFKFVQAMSDCNRVLCGDALQNIYQFRGCSNKPLKDLMNSESWVKYELPVNYRSSKNVCDYVNGVSETFSSKDYRVVLRSKRPGPCVREFVPSSHESKYDALAKYVSKMSNIGSVAILCRTNFEADECNSELKKRGVDSSNNKEKDYYTDILKAVYDEGYKNKLVQSYMTSKQYSMFRSMLLQGMTFDEALESNLWDEDTLFMEVLQDVQVVEEVLAYEDVSYSTFILCDMFDVDKPDIELEDSNDLVQYLLNKVQSKETPTVYVGTIHSVKGLEFNSVAVMGVNSKAFKIDNEERENLLYTALTRARNNLIVFYENK